MATDLGGERKFSKFYNLKKDLGKNDNVYINQQMGNNLGADEIEMSDPRQYAFVINPHILGAHDMKKLIILMKELSFLQNDQN